ncbi:MAG: DnaA N-terminal domain-containing protein [Pseudomonadota bacterium]
MARGAVRRLALPERGFTTETWDEMWFRRLSKDQRYLYWYLSTNQHCNQAGVYPIALDQIAFEAKVPEDSLPELLRSLSPYVAWYQKEDYVWVRDFVKKQLKSPKFLIAVAKSLTTVNVNGLAKEVVDYNLQQYSIAIPYQYTPTTVPILARASDLICSSSSSSSDLGEEVAQGKGSPKRRKKQSAKLWAQVLADIQAHVSKANYGTWFAHTVGLGEADGQFFVGVPRQYELDYIEQNQRSLVERSLEKISGKPANVVFEVIEPPEKSA